jgi:hypothetical protein
MTPGNGIKPLLQGINIGDYNIKNLNDEMRVDSLCVDLLRHLYQDLTQGQGVDAEEAGSLCRGADYFLREFIIAEKCENLLQIEALRVRQFAGHWYITRTPEPNLTELGEILAGTEAFYRFLSQQQLIKNETAEAIAKHCRNRDFYQTRIDAFWEITDDGFDTWRQGCPL